MKMSREGLAELVRSEGSRAQVYDDKNGRTIASFSEAQGYPTIGVGHLITPSQYSRFERYLAGREAMSQSQIQDLLSEDLPKYEKPVSDAIQVTVTPQMFDALVSLAFNAGPNSYAVKNAIKEINQKNWEGAAQAIADGPKTSKGVLVQGLVKRRANEAQWFLSGGTPTTKTAIIQTGLSAFQSVPNWVWWTSGGVILITSGLYIYKRYK